MHIPAIISRSIDHFKVVRGHWPPDVTTPIIHPTGRRIDAGTVLLVPDFADLAEDLLPLGTALKAAGYRVATLGATWATKAVDRLSSLAEAADALVALANTVGPVAAVIGHGTGATVAMLALGRHRFADNAVLIAADPHGTERVAPDLGDIRSLLIHSADDEIAPLHDALELAEAWPNSMLERVERLGHRRILTSQHSAAAVLRFLDGADAVQRSLH